MELQSLRTQDQVESLVADAISQELARARAGEQEAVSTRAAARYLDVHVETLGEWRRKDPPEGPVWEKGPQGGGVGNQHVKYPWPELVEWKKSRKGLTPRQRRAVDERLHMEHQARIVEEQIRFLEAKRTLAALQKKLARMSFATVGDLAMEHDWIMRDGVVLGHARTVSEQLLRTALDSSPDNLASMPLIEALELPWFDWSSREPFETAANAVLQEVAGAIALGERLGREARADREHAELRSGGETLPQGEPRRP